MFRKNNSAGVPTCFGHIDGDGEYLIGIECKRCKLLNECIRRSFMRDRMFEDIGDTNDDILDNRHG